MCLTKSRFAFNPLISCQCTYKYSLVLQVAFLMPGHTHEDIDQRFSVLSRYLKIHDAITPSSWKMAVVAAFKARREERPNEPYEGVPIIRTLHSMHAFTAWLAPHIDPKYEGTNGPFLFQFYHCDTRKRCVQRWKHSSTSVEWYPHGRIGELGGDAMPNSCLMPESLDSLNRDNSPPIRDLKLLPAVAVEQIKECVALYVRGT
jgi:hypothetical protein